MQNAGKSRKALVIGVIAAVVILAVVLALVLTQCVGGTTENTVPTTTAEPVAPTYELYWNVDRAEYEGKSEAGMSSRMPESDGYFHVRFILDGEEVTVKVADRKLINAIDVKDLMGLEFDESGIVVGVLDLEDMPLEKLGWQFYVQSAAKTLIKLNSSESMNGMEVLLETDENTGIYDMSGKSGPVGSVTDPIQMDRVYAIANLDGEVTHVFIYQRPNYMLTHEAECQHCKKVVTWYEWVKEDQVPLTSGHYQLQNDIQLKAQPAQQEDAKVCLDLNGYRVDGAKNSRCYAMFNAGTELAIMDTSEAQTGVMAAHGKGDQGMVVWVRYGAFYLYGGTLDASDATTKLSGTAIECGKGKYFYMYGGTIIGGTAEPQKNDKGAWTQGLGGTMSLGGKFVMYGGEIRDGKAPAKVTGTKASPVYNRGYGGNIYASSSAVIELNGGVIKNGTAGNVGGNIFLDGAAELTINGGQILGGTIRGKGKNGGNIFAGSKTKITMSSGVIAYGSARNCAGNLYTNGLFVMTGGSVFGGTIRDFTTGKIQENNSSANIFNVNGQLKLYGGKIEGYVQCIDTSDTDNKDTSVYVTTNIVIDGGEGCTRNLVLSPDGSGITVRVGKMSNKARVGVYATTGYFSLPTMEENKDNFFSDIEGADILYHDSRLALGRMQCVCGSNSDNVEEHLGACKEVGGEKVVFAPWMTTTSMPNKQGNYYLNGTAEVFNMNGTSVVTPGDGKGRDVVVNVDLNGKQIVSKSGRFYSLFENKVAQDENGNYLGNIADEHIELSLSDSVGTAKVTMNARSYSDMGFLVWGRYVDSVITIYGGEYDGSAVAANSHDGAIINASGKLNIHGGHFVGGHSNRGGIISARDLYMDGGIIEKGTANYSGGNIRVYGNSEIHGGIIRDGSINADGTLVGDLAYGGNVAASGTFHMYGGEISGGLVKIGVKGTKPDGTAISAGGGLGGNILAEGKVYLHGGVVRDGDANHGGNIGTNIGNSEIHLDGDAQVLNGVASSNGGNIAINVRSGKFLTIADNALVSGGNAAGNGGNVYVNAWSNNNTPVTINMAGGTVEKGVAARQGGNFYLTNSSGQKTFLNVSGGKILDGATKDVGGNIHLAGGAALTVSGGEIMGGQGNNGVYNPANNVYAVNAYTEITGGKVEGFAATNTVANGNTVKISGNPQILPARGGSGISLATWVSSGTANFDRPYIELGTLTEGADITVGTWGYISTETAEANAQYIKASNDDVDTCYVDNRIFLGKVACICGGTATKGACAEGGHKKVAWLPLESQTINANGNYYLLKDIAVANQITMGKDVRPTDVSINLNGHTMTTGFRVFQIWSTNAATLNVADHKGGGAILSRGNSGDNFGGIQMLGNASTVNFYSGKLGFTEGHKTHKEIALIEASGTFNMYGGEIAGDGQPSGTLIRVGGTFNMYGGTVKDGYNALTVSDGTCRGGNFRVSGTLNVFGGTISGGKAQYGGNIAATGKVNISGDAQILNGHAYTGGATIYPQGGNIYLTGSGAKLTMDGGTISGGTLTGSNWMPGGNIYANSKAQIVLDGGAIVKDGQGQDGGNIYLTTDGTTATLKNCTITNSAEGKSNIQVERGTVTIDGANIITTAANGVNLSANETGKVANYILNSGSVTGGKPNVRLGGDDTFVMNGGTMETSGAQNVVIEKNTTFTMKGGEIKGGTGTHGGNVSVANSKFVLDGGKILNGTATGYAGNLAASGASTVEILSGEISGGKAATAGNIVIWDSAKLYVKGGEIKDSTATGTGGNILLDGSTYIEISGGTISGGKANGGTGGNLVFWGSSTGKMTGGTISGGTSSANGGNVNIATKNTFTMTGGTITGGSSGDSAGNICVYGKLVMSGGTVTNGKCKYEGNGMNISIVKSSDAGQATLELSGGTIAGGLHFNNYTGNCIVSLSGNPVIDKELATENKPTYSMKLDKNDLTIGTLTEGAKIMVSGSEGVFSYACPAGSEKYFDSEVEGLAVWQIDGELTLVHGKEASCVCGVNSDNLADHIGECDGVKHNWLPVTALPETSGYYYLVGDVTDSGNQRIVKDTTQTLNIYLDLNGKTVTTSRWRMYRLDSSVNLTITDNSAAKTGTIKISGETRDQGAGVWFFSGTSTFSMYGGTFDATGIKNSTADAAGMVLAGGGTMKLFAGTVKGGEVTRETNQGGSAMELSGGRVHYFGNIEVTGGAGSEIFMGNNAKIDLSNVTEAPETPWSVDASGVFTKGWNKDWNIADYFVAESVDGNQIYLDEATGELAMGTMDCTCRQDTCICDGEQILWQPWRAGNYLPTVTGNYYLQKDVSNFGQHGITSTTQQDVKIDLAGHSVTANKGNRIYLVQNTNVLTITDSVGGGVMAGGGSNNNNCGVFLMQGSTVLNLYAGKLTLSADAYRNMTYAGIMEIGSAFNMYGGEVTGGYAVRGGNIVVGNGDVCRIMGGKVTDGHGVYEGTESKYGRGGNISMDGSAVVEISGKAEISGGVASTIINGTANWMPGGNINVSGGRLTVDGDAVIKGGSAGDGINIYMSNASAIIDLKKCTVLNTNAGNANIVVEAGTLNVMDGALVKNTATGVRNIATNNSGNNVAIINIKGGTVTGGNTTGGNNGGNIVINGNDILNVSGGVIEDGISENQAGNISIHGTFTMTGGTIRDGKAKSDGDGHNICITSPSANSKANVTISGGTIAGGLVFNNFYTTPNLKISGAPTIDKSKTSSDAAVKPSYSINMPTSFDIDVTGLTGGKIYIKGTEGDKFAVNATSGMEKYFVSETSTPVCYQDGGLYFGQVYCLCGYTKSGTTLSAHEYWCDKVDHVWLPWDGSHFMTSGYYYATGTKNPAQTSIGNSDTDAELVTAHVVFDLNGKTLTAGGRSFRVENGSFSVTDTVGGGKVVAGGTSTQAGSILVTNGTTINLYKGDWTMTAGKSAGSNGGIVEIGTGVVLNMYSGTISGGTALNQGGNVSVAGGTFNFYGGTITGGTALQGGNVRITSGTFNMVPHADDTKGSTRTISAGKASHTTSYAKGGNIYVSGSAAVLNISGEKSIVTGGTTSSIVNGSTTWAPGGNICVESSAKATVSNGAKVEKGTAGVASQGNNFYMTGGSSSITLNSAIVNNTVGAGDGNIVLEAGTLTIKGTTEITTVNGCRNICTNDNGNAVINVQGGTITGAEFIGNGANIWISGRATLNITGGTITGGKAISSGDTHYSGGNIYIKGTVTKDGTTYNAKFAMSAGTISNGEARWGGNIYIAGGSNNYTISGGTITGGKSVGNGGNIFHYGNMTISGGEIKNGSNSDGGGNIASYGTLTITGGKIYGGSANGNYRSNIYSQRTVKVSGGEIWGGVTMHNLGSANLEVSGAAVINGKLNATAIPGITFWGYQTNLAKPLTITGKLTGTACIGINMSDWVFAVAGDYNKDSMKAFYADNGAQSIYQQDDKTLYIGQLHCVCGATGSTHNIYTDVSGNKVGCDGTVLKWTAWTSTTSLPTATGNYYLTSDVNLASTVEVKDSSNVVLDLNGKTVTIEATRMYTLSSGTLTITNTKSTGGIVSANTAAISGSAVSVAKSTTLNLYNVDVSMTGTTASGQFAGLLDVTGTLNIFGETVIRNGKTGSSTCAGNIRIVNSGSVMNMYDGVIRDGKATNAGHNIQCWGTINMFGDALITNTYNANSGNIQLAGNSAVLNMNGGKISGDTCTYQTPTINLKGNAQITKGVNCGLLLGNGVVINVTGKLTGEEPIAVNVNTAPTETAPVEFAKGNGITLTMASKAWFQSAAGNDIGLFDDDHLYMVPAGAHMHCVCGGNETGNPNHKCYDYCFAAATALGGKIESDSNLYLTGDMTISDTIYLYSSDVKICMNGHSIKGSHKYRAISLHDKTNANPKLTLTTCKNAGDKTKNVVGFKSAFTRADMGQVLWVRYGTAHIYGVTLDGSNITTTNVYTASSDTTSEKNGGAVKVDSATTMYIYEGANIIASTTAKLETTKADGTAKSVYAPNGAGLHIAGTAVMYGGTITGGNSANDAGAAYVTGTFTMHNGTIIGGNVANDGGALRVNGTFTMNDGEIYGGKANRYGGNIAVLSNGKAYINGGEIYGGEAGYLKTQSSMGGNIYISGANAELTVKNATIKDGGRLKVSGDTVDPHGGNIAVGSAGAKVFNLGEGTVISGGKGHRGANIYITELSGNYNTYVIDGATIENGSTSYTGANINVYHNKSANPVVVTFKSGLISLPNNSGATNIALGAGAGGSCYATFKMEGGTVNGGKIDLFKNSVFEFVAGTITNYTKTGNGSMVFADPVTE